MLRTMLSVASKDDSHAVLSVASLSVTLGGGGSGTTTGGASTSPARVRPERARIRVKVTKDFFRLFIASPISFS
jgi:hypothetical protein